MEEIRIGATAPCTDGKAGSVVALVVDPVQRSLTHIVVRQRHHLDAFEWLVPVGMVQSATHEDITGWHDQRVGGHGAVHQERAICRSPPPRLCGVAERRIYVALMPPRAAAGQWQNSMKRFLRLVHRGVKVFATDGAIGEVGEFVIDPGTGHITHIVLQQGHMWHKRRNRRTSRSNRPRRWREREA